MLMIQILACLPCWDISSWKTNKQDLYLDQRAFWNSTIKTPSAEYHFQLPTIFPDNSTTLHLTHSFTTGTSRAGSDTLNSLGFSIHNTSKMLNKMEVSEKLVQSFFFDWNEVHLEIQLKWRFGKQTYLIKIISKTCFYLWKLLTEINFTFYAHIVYSNKLNHFSPCVLTM